MTEKQIDLFGKHNHIHHIYKVISKNPYKKVCKECGFVSFIKYVKSTI